MMNNYTSDELFHFVGHKSPREDDTNYKNLSKILRSNCVSHSPHDNTWGTVSYVTTWDSQLETEQLIVPTVTCYADIPFDALSTHVNKYGKFSVALPSSLLTKYGARPVMYIPMRADDYNSINGLTLLRDIEAIVKAFNEHVVEKYGEEPEVPRALGDKPNTAQAAVAALSNLLLKDFLAFIKPFNSELPHDHVDNYYMEREWRKYGNMKFEAIEVSKVLVAKGYREKVAKDFPAYEGRIYEI